MKIPNDVNKYAITNGVIKFAIKNDVIKFAITNDVIDKKVKTISCFLTRLRNSRPMFRACLGCLHFLGHLHFEVIFGNWLNDVCKLLADIEKKQTMSVKMVTFESCKIICSYFLKKYFILHIHNSWLLSQPSVKEV